MEIVALVLLVFVGIYLFLVFPAVRRHKHRALLDGRYIAHRGLHSLADDIPENSLAAFEAARDAGFAAECDIHLTADGHVVVFHDSVLARMCGVDGTVEDKTLDELRRCRLNGTVHTLPTLQELLSLINGHVPLLIEFKCNRDNYRALCEAADAVLQGYDGIYLVQSFYPPAMAWYKRHRPHICRGQLSSGFKGAPLAQRLLARLVFNFLSRPDFVSYDRQFANRLSLKLNVFLGAFPVGWTFCSQQELDRHHTDFRTYIFEHFVPIQ